MMTHDIASSQTSTTLTSTQNGSHIHASSHTKRSPNSQIHEDHRLSLLFLLLVLIAGLAGSTILFLVPIAGLSSGSIGIVVFFLVGSFFFLLFALTGASVGASSFESDIDLCTAELDLNKRQQSNSSNKIAIAV